MSAVLPTDPSHSDHGHADHAHDDHHHGAPTGWRRWVFATNHKDIGTLYLLFSFTMLMVGGVLALLIRAELFQPGLQLVNPELFNQLTTMHGLIMVFGAIMPAFVGFANWMLPLQIGASDMAFARMNNFSFWLLPVAAIMLTASFFVPGGATAAGWTLYAPLSLQMGPGMDLAIFAMHIMGASSIIGISTGPAVMARTGARRGMLLTMLTFAVGIVLVGLGANVFGSVPVVIVGMVLFGFGNGSVDVMMNVEATAIEQRMGRTILPVFHAFFSFGTVIGAVFGIPLGVLAAVKRGSLVDQIVRVIGLVGYSVPIFWLGMLALLIFYARLGWTSGPGRIDITFEYTFTPITGFYLIDAILQRDWPALKDIISHLILPSALLGYFSLAYISRMTRSFMLNELEQEYIVAARAKGISETRIIWGHALRNAAVPLVTVIALSYAGLLEGSVLTETIFSWPGLGLYITNSLQNADMNAVLGGTIVIGSVFIALNLVSDLLYRVLDPRTRVR